MTDKLIIDGVDVSGCEFFTTGNHNTYCICNSLKPCEKYSFCHYKEKLRYQQSARKDERIRELELLSSQMTCKLEKLAHENGELKQKLSQIAQEE